MSINSDFSDLFTAFNDASVRYLVVGAYAVIFYTEPRYTKDLDIWVDATPENAQRVYQALATFGAPLDDVSIDDFANRDMVYQIGIEPNRIDILMGVEGIPFDAAFERAERSSYGGVPIRILAVDDLIATKQAAGRPQDQLDLTRLAKVGRRQ